ncbi:homeobox domain protein [Teladorsagia circumcincta]|uniref:Homeobox domain protein n=1 Tax=Teladorsagia circumcincta TaxID=45464 RepID=A0A2G9V579_TELCI|nr:homeobox domain protein [Teladorsagia circumcincta]
MAVVVDGSNCRRREVVVRIKTREVMDPMQIAMLEQRFASQKYLNSVERSSLAEELKMSDAQDTKQQMTKVDKF